MRSIEAQRSASVKRGSGVVRKEMPRALGQQQSIRKEGKS
jgi:hypothetical protein